MVVSLSSVYQPSVTALHSTFNFVFIDRSQRAPPIADATDAILARWAGVGDEQLQATLLLALAMA